MMATSYNVVRYHTGASIDNRKLKGQSEQNLNWFKHYYCRRNAYVNDTIGLCILNE
jgi:hypothetical protein